MKGTCLVLACKLLDDVTVLPFFQLTLYLTDNTRDRSNKQIIAVFSLVVIYQKSPAENAGDCNSKTLIFKNFLGEHAPRLPYIFFPCVHLKKISSYALGMIWLS